MNRQEWVTEFVNEMVVNQDRPVRVAQQIAAVWCISYMERGMAPRTAAKAWVHDHTPPKPGKPQPKLEDAGMGRQNRAGEIEVVEEAMRRPVTKRKDKR